MSEYTDTEYQRLVNRFWHNYLSLLENFSIPTKARPWYRKHVEEYIIAHQGVKLHHHKPQQIDKYLAAKGGMGSLQGPQSAENTRSRLQGERPLLGSR